MYSLQEQGWPGHVGGRSALELQGAAHYLPLGGVRRIHLYGAATLPHWLAQAATPVQFDLHSRRLFDQPPPDAITNRPFGHWDWPLRLATPELALLEILPEIKTETDFDLADKYFESSSVLRPALVSAILRTCTSVKAKRLFLWFSIRHGHQWHTKVDLDGVDLGSGKRSIIAGGTLDKRYQITVPRSMASGGDQFF